MGGMRFLSFLPWCFFWVNSLEGVIISWDSEFIHHFLDPLGATGDSPLPTVPPLLIAEGGQVAKAYDVGSPQVTFDKDVMNVKFNIWDGDKITDLRPYTVQGTQMVVKADENVKVKTIETVGETTMMQLSFSCLQDVTSVVKVSLPTLNVEFAVKKECHKSHSRFFEVYTKNGQLAAKNGIAEPAFNVHEAQEVSYISAENEGQVEFILRSVGMPYTIEKIEVNTYQPPANMLGWIAHSRPELEKIFFKEIKDSGKDTEEDKEDKEGEYEYEEDEEKGGNTTRVKPYKSKEKLFIKEHSLTVSELHNSERALPSHILEPVLSGAAMEEGAKIKNKATRGFDFSKLGKSFNKKGMRNSKKILKKLATLSMGGTRLSIDYHCIDEGIAVVEIDIFIAKHLKDAEEFHEKVSMSWLKICESKKVKGSSVSLMGFDVRLGAYIDGNSAFYAVRDGLVTKPFSSKNHALQVSAEEKETSFYVSIDPEVWAHNKEKEDSKKNKITIIGTQVTSKRRDICDPKLYGHAARGGEISVEPLPITVQYNCKAEGDTVIHLIMDVALKEGDDGSERILRLLWAWEKEAEVLEMDVLDIKTIDPSLFDARSSVSTVMDTDAALTKAMMHSTYVVKHGKIQKPFKPQIYSFELGASDDVVAFQIESLLADIFKNSHMKRKGHKTAMALHFNQPHIESSSSSCIVSIRDIGEMEMLAVGDVQTDDDYLKSQEVYSVTSKSPAYIVVDHQCINSGDAKITLTLTFENTHKFILQWGKKCDISNANVPVTHAFGAGLFTMLLGVVLTSLICVWRNQSQLKRAYESVSQNKEGFDKMAIS